MKKLTGAALVAWITGTFYELGRKHGKALDLGPERIGSALTGLREKLINLAAAADAKQGE